MLSVGGHARESVDAGGENAQTTFPHTSVMFYCSACRETPTMFSDIFISGAIYLKVSFPAHIGIIDFIFINVVAQHTLVPNISICKQAKVHISPNNSFALKI